MMPESSPLMQRRNRTPWIDMPSKSMSNPISSRVEQQIMITQHVLVIPHKSIIPDPRRLDDLWRITRQGYLKVRSEPSKRRTASSG